MGLGVTKTYKSDINNIKYASSTELYEIIHPIGINIFPIGYFLFPIGYPLFPIVAVCSMHTNWPVPGGALLCCCRTFGSAQRSCSAEVARECVAPRVA